MSGEARHVAVERVGRVAVLTLQRPPVNALDDRLVADLEAAFAAAAADAAVSAVLVRGGERAFCAGADLARMRAAFATPGGVDGMLDLVRRMQRLFAAIEAAPVVTLAEIGGAALGGGLELALACDLRVAALEAKLGLPEIGLGLVAGAGGTQRLTRLCGKGVAARLILGGEVVDGALAERLGVVQWAFPRAELKERAAAIAARLAGATRAAVEANKRCIRAAVTAGEDGFAEELAATRALYDDPDTRLLVDAFLARKGATR